MFKIEKETEISWVFSKGVSPLCCSKCLNFSNIIFVFWQNRSKNDVWGYSI